jgi:hypothetical protein
MKAIRFFLLISMAVAAVEICMAQADVQKTLGNLDISAIKNMQMVKGSDGYFLKLTVILTNQNAEALRLRNGDFELTFDRAKGGLLDLGKTSVADTIVPGKKSAGPGTADMLLDVAVGPKNEQTVDRLTEMFNLIGDPVANLRMVVKGRSEVGLQLPRGWFFEQGKKLEVELVWTPEIKREIVLK